MTSLNYYQENLTFIENFFKYSLYVLTSTVVLLLILAGNEVEYNTFIGVIMWLMVISFITTIFNVIASKYIEYKIENL